MLKRPVQTRQAPDKGTQSKNAASCGPETKASFQLLSEKTETTSRGWPLKLDIVNAKGARSTAKHVGRLKPKSLFDFERPAETSRAASA
jgi:hypothetical protein